MQNVSEEFKQAISQPSREIESRITFPDLVLDDYQVKSINLDSLLVGSDDFEIGTAPMDMVKVELVEDTGDEWGRNLLKGTSSEWRSISFASWNYYLGDSLEAKPNETYTFRLEYRNPTGIRFTVRIFEWDENNVRTESGNGTFVEIGEQGYSELTYTTTSTAKIIQAIIRAQRSSGGSVEYRFAKLEKSSVATPWTPAPEDYANYDYKDKECDIELGLTLPDESVEYVSIGKYTVENAVRKNNTITLDCVDRMYKAEKDYVSDLMYPTTILDILESACDQAGIELATTTFANSDYIVPNEPVYEGVTCRKVFAQVAELAGGYAKINRLGQLEIVTLGNESVRDITKDHYIDFRRDEVAIGKIDRVIVKVGDETAERGTGEDIYTIVDNMFVQNPNNVVDALYSVLKNVSYTACTLKWQGDFSLDLGDKVTVDGHDTYILDRSLKYTGGLRETYRAPAKSNIEKESTGKRSLTLEMANYKSELRIVKEGLSYNIKKVEEVEGDLGDLADRLEEAEFKIEPGRIVQTVRQSEEYLEDLGDVETAAKAYAELKAQEEVENLEIGTRNLFSLQNVTSHTPYNTSPTVEGTTITTTIVRDTGTNLTIRDHLQQYRIIDQVYTVSGYITKNSEPIDISFFSARVIHNQWQQISLTVDPATGYFVSVARYLETANTYLFHCRTNAVAGDVIEIDKLTVVKGTKPADWTPAPEDVDEAISAVDTKYSNKVAEIDTTIDSITQRVSSTESDITTINGIVASHNTRLESAESKITPSAIVDTVRSSTAYTNDLSGKVDTTQFESYRLQTAQLIEDRVEKDGVIAAISLSPETAKIQANKIKLEGLVTANSNFKILTDGSIEAKNATISGIVTAISGSIGDWSINNSIYSKHGDTYTTLKGSGLVAFATGAPDPNTTTGANLQIFHDGRIRKSSDGTQRILIDDDRINFYDPTGAFGGQIIADTSHDTWSTILSIQPSSTGYLSLHTRDPQTYGSDYAVIQVLPKSGDYSNRVRLETRGTNVASDYAHVELEDGWVDINASRGLWMYGTIYMDDGMGTPSTIRVLTSYDRQGLLIRADEAGSSAGINLYGEYDSNYPSTMMLRSGGQTTLSLDANRDARFYGNLRVDGAITSPTIIELTQNTRVTGWLQPKTNNTYSLGGGSSRWSRIFLQYNPDVASDIRLKSSIQNIPNGLLGELKEIQPKMYQQGEKWHFGYIAQDVERALYKYALKEVGWDKAKDYVREFDVLYKDESYLSLVYAEIAVLKEAEMQARIDELEARLLALEQAC